MSNEISEAYSEMTDGSHSGTMTPNNIHPDDGEKLQVVSSLDMDVAVWPSVPVEVRANLQSQHRPSHNAEDRIDESQSILDKDCRDVSREIFVGDLSYFCRDHHLSQLFGRYGVVEKARVRLGDNKKNSLMFAFIRMKTAEAASAAAQALNGFLFMGRTLRVQLCNVDGTPSAYEPKFGFQIHVSFISYQTISIYVTEETLRSLFEPYGLVVDAVVCRHTMHINPPKQSGYGFVYMEQQESTAKAIADLRSFDINGIRFECSISHRSNHHPTNSVATSNSTQPPIQPSNRSASANSPPSTPSTPTAYSSSSSSTSAASSMRRIPPRIQIPPEPTLGAYLPSPTYIQPSHQYQHQHHSSPPPAITNAVMQTIPMPAYPMHPGNTMCMYADGHMVPSYVAMNPGMAMYPPPPTVMLNSSGNPAMQSHHSGPHQMYQAVPPVMHANYPGNAVPASNAYLMPRYEMAPRGMPHNMVNAPHAMVINGGGSNVVMGPPMQMMPHPTSPTYASQMAHLSFSNSVPSVANHPYMRRPPPSDNHSPDAQMYSRDNYPRGPPRYHN